MASSKPDSIYAKLLAVQSELKAPKGQFNSFGKYHYRSAEDIIEAAKPVVAQYGLALLVSDTIVLIGERYYVKATARVIDEEGKDIPVDGYAREDDDKKGMDGAQITGAASSYARKYALNGLLAIDDTKDADTDEHTARIRPPVGSAKQTQATQPVTPKPSPEPAEADGDRRANTVQLKMMLSRAKAKSGLQDRDAVIEWFVERVGASPTDILASEVPAVLKVIQEAQA